MGDFKDKVVLVTGAGKGIGRAVAVAFATRGAIVAANDITPVNLDETVARITASGGYVKAYVEDIAKKMPVQALVNEVLDDWGRIDILVNSAEVAPSAQVLEMDDWDWQRTLDVNLTGAFLLTQSVGRVMRASSQKGGKDGGIIIHIGYRARSPDRHAAYFASKAGLLAFVEHAARELAAYGICVHLILPAETDDVTEKVISLVEAELHHS
jgi:NAD(P)-dependent dehydrogenase (short-subunit alcohol dehydrogenase family)